MLHLRCVASDAVTYYIQFDSNDSKPRANQPASNGKISLQPVHHIKTTDSEDLLKLIAAIALDDAPPTMHTPPEVLRTLQYTLPDIGIRPFPRAQLSCPEASVSKRCASLENLTATMGSRVKLKESNYRHTELGQGSVSG